MNGLLRDHVELDKSLFHSEHHHHHADDEPCDEHCIKSNDSPIILSTSMPSQHQKIEDERIQKGNTTLSVDFASNFEVVGANNEAYLSYLKNHLTQNKPGKPMSPEAFEEFMLDSSPGNPLFEQLKLFTKKVVQTCRLMVGIQDYDIYLQHMKMHHPDLPPLDRDAFYRYCLDSRFGANGNVNKCPC